MVGVRGWVDVPIDDVIGVAARSVVVALSFLVLDDLRFLLDHVPGHRVDEVPHSIRFGPEHLFQRVPWDNLVIIRPVSVGRAVHAPTNLVDQHIDTARAEVFRIEEEQVFEQVREPGLAGTLTGRADVVGHRDGDDRVRAVDVKHHVEAVLERVPSRSQPRMRPDRTMLRAGKRRPAEGRGATRTASLVLWNRINRHYLAALLYSCFAGRSAGGRRRRLFSRQRKHL